MIPVPSSSRSAKEKTMNDDASQPLKCCPFWSAVSLKCQICTGGLFIPLDDHMDVYCKTPHYTQCLQYSLQQNNHLEIAGTTGVSKRNRRKFPRIEENHKITLVKLIESGEVATHLSAPAKTLDLSNGGMRLTTDKPLNRKSLIHFSFDHSFPENLQKVRGQVAWCNKEIDTPGYQAGISFQDYRTLEAMNRYLNVSRNHPQH